MSQQESTPQFDPFAMWKQFQDNSMKIWAEVMRDYVDTDEFSKLMSQYMDTYLSTSAPLQRQIEEAMENCLQQINVASRNELLDLAERLTHLEMRLDDIDAKLDELLDLAKSGAKESDPNG